MSEYVWETFDALFTAIYKQGCRIEELEQRIASLEAEKICPSKLKDTSRQHMTSGSKKNPASDSSQGAKVNQSRRGSSNC